MDWTMCGSNTSTGKSSTLTLGSTQPHIQYVTGLFPWGTGLGYEAKLVPKLRVGGVTPLFLLYTFIVWTGTT
jgi:hypothetical protein